MKTAAFAATCAAALLLGAGIGAFWDPPRWLRAALLAFAAGALITALAFELFEEAHREAGLITAAIALVVGVAVFTVVDLALTKKFGGRGAVGPALVAAVTLDGVPENAALGVTLQEGGSYALLAAIFASNFPEALGGAASSRSDGVTRARAFATWVVVAALLVLALLGGHLAAGVASAASLGILLAFAAGAVLASIADTIMPEAFGEGGPLIAFATVGGFLVAYGLATV